MEIKSQIVASTQFLQMIQAMNSASGQNAPTEAPLDFQDHGDTVQISAEARALLEEQLAQYKDKSPDDLTDEDREDIKDILEDVLGPTPKAGPRGPAGSESTEESDASSVVGVMGGAGVGSGSSASDIQELEDKIEELEKEIASLIARSDDNPGNEVQVQIKRIELASLQSQLAELKAQQA